ncbi:hypothetical protein GR255_16525, partial [Mycobacterium tuberculosis]|nr:hypothetical protein [Mycobacterium tuberculosis]
MGLPASFTEAVADPLGELLGRYARTHTPFTTAAAAARARFGQIRRHRTFDGSDGLRGRRAGHTGTAGQ